MSRLLPTRHGLVLGAVAILAVVGPAEAAKGPTSSGRDNGFKLTVKPDRLTYKTAILVVPRKLVGTAYRFQVNCSRTRSGEKIGLIGGTTSKSKRRWVSTQSGISLRRPFCEVLFGPDGIATEATELRATIRLKRR